MTSSVFLDMNFDLQRVFAHDTGDIVWHRPAGPTDGHSLTAWYDEASIVASAGGIDMVAMPSRITVFVPDIIAIDPARASWPQEELFRNNGSDTFTVDGKVHRVESCTADGHGKVTVELKAT